MVLAIATRKAVVLYDTQQLTPFAVISNMHYACLTDITWSHDGRLLAVSSIDGYCSLVSFEQGELGTEYVKEEEIVEETENQLDVSGCLELAEADEEAEVKKVVVKKKPNILEQWTIKTPKKPNSEKKDEKKVAKDVIEIPDEDVKTIEVRKKPREAEKNDVKTIEVRKKPREAEKNDVKTIEVRKVPRVSDVKTIEVRKKPREVETSSKPTAKDGEKDLKKQDQKTDSDIVEISDDDDDDNDVNKINNSEKTKAGAKPIEVRRRPRESETSDKRAVNTPKKLKTDEKKDKKPKQEKKDANGTSAQREAKPIEVRRKSKVPDSEPKKTDKTPKKNSLLSFLKKTPKSATQKIAETVPPILVEEHAQQPWTCNETEKPAEPVVDLTDCSVDLTLHLEDSLLDETGKENCEKMDVDKKELETNNKEESVKKKKCEDVSMDSSVDLSLRLEDSLEDEKGGENMDCVEICVDKCVEDKNIQSLKSSEPVLVSPGKEKRRIPLITLSSPKNKKKSSAD